MIDDGLRVDVSHLGEVTILTVRGEIDANSALALRASLDQIGLEQRVRVDMAAVRFMDSSGLHVLLAESIRKSEIGGSIHICNPSRPVRRVVEVSGLCEVLFETNEMTEPSDG